MIGKLGEMKVRWAGVEQLSQALRRLRRDRAFTAAFVVTLALGIAANLAVFSALDVYFLRPLPYPDAGKLVDVYFGATKYSIPPGAMSAPAYEQLQSARALFSSGLLLGLGNRTVAIGGEPLANERVVAVTASMLATLGVRPLLGRWISPAADRPGGPSEVDVSYRLWQSAFHRDPRVLGRTIRISDELYTVVGVMPSSFAFPTRQMELWVPITLTPATLGPQNLMNLNFLMVARLRPGASGVELHSQLAGVLARLEHSMAPDDRAGVQQIGFYLGFTPLRQLFGGTTRGRLLMMQLGAGVLLLLAVASLVNLALARALRRRDEAALRVVLGAGRRVLLAQALLEALPLAAAAILVAWPLADLGVGALAHYGIASANTSFELHIGAALWVLAFALALVLSGIALALPLAFVRVQRPAELLYGTGKGGGSGHRMRPLRFALSVGQIALATALLAGALLLGRSLLNMLNSDPGFDGHDLYTATLLLQGPQYEKAGGWLAAHQRLTAAVAALPGVSASGLGEAVPFSANGSNSSFSPAEDKSPSAPSPLGAITLTGSGLMKTLGVHLLAGRLLDANDPATNVVIDERFADALFGKPDGVGRTLSCGIDAGTCRIVGVIGTIQDRFASFYSFANGTVFVPEQPGTFRIWGHRATTILIRSSEPPAILAQEVRNVVRRTLPDQSLTAFAPMHQLISDSAQGAAALASLLIAFGLLAFTLAIIGTYGVVAYVTGLRRREFAVRQAVGAKPIQIESLVLGQGLVLWALGTLVGVACALILARPLAAELYQVSVFSPGTYVLPAIVVGAAVMLASWIPARGARKLDLVAQIRPE